MVLSVHLCQVLQPWRWYGSRFSGPVCLNRPYVVGSLLGQIGSIFSLACLVYRSRCVSYAVLSYLWKRTSRVTRVTLVLWTGNETLRSLAKLLTLPTGFFSAEKTEEWMARSPVWPDDVIASEMASRHQPMNWRDSIWVSDSVTKWAFPMRKLRSVSFPIQRTRVTRVTRDVFKCMTIRNNSSFITWWLNDWRHMDHFNDVLTTFLSLWCGSSVGVYEGSESSWISFVFRR